MLVHCFTSVNQINILSLIWLVNISKFKSVAKCLFTFFIINVQHIFRNLIEVLNIFNLIFQMILIYPQFLSIYFYLSVSRSYKWINSLQLLRVSVVCFFFLFKKKKMFLYSYSVQENDLVINFKVLLFFLLVFTLSTPRTGRIWIHIWIKICVGNSVVHVLFKNTNVRISNNKNKENMAI